MRLLPTLLPSMLLTLGPVLSSSAKLKQHCTTCWEGRFTVQFHIYACWNYQAECESERKRQITRLVSFQAGLKSNAESLKHRLYIADHSISHATDLPQIFIGIGPGLRFVVSRIGGSQSGEGRANSKR